MHIEEHLAVKILLSTKCKEFIYMKALLFPITMQRDTNGRGLLSWHLLFCHEDRFLNKELQYPVEM